MVLGLAHPDVPDSPNMGNPGKREGGSLLFMANGLANGQ